VTENPAVWPTKSIEMHNSKVGNTNLLMHILNNLPRECESLRSQLLTT